MIKFLYLNNLLFRCIYRFEGQRGETVRIVIKKVMTGNRTCASKIDSDINRSFCYGDNTARVEVIFYICKYCRII